jgi:hypothetical protein
MTYTLERAVADPEAMGIHRDLITKAVGRDVGLVMAAAPLICRRIRDRSMPPVMNRVGFFLSVINIPTKYGLSCHGRVWHAPGKRGRKRPAPCILSLEERRAKKVPELPALLAAGCKVACTAGSGWGPSGE